MEPTRRCDVVIIGMGPSGCGVMNSLLDAGFDVCGIEKLSMIGGGPFQSGAIDIFRNTTFAVENGFANFTLTNPLLNASTTNGHFDFAKYIQRFVRDGTVIGFPVFGYNTNYWVDVENGMGVNTTVPPVNFTEDLQKLSQAMFAHYPFLEQPFYPRTMPPEMSGSFQKYLNAVRNCTLYNGHVCAMWAEFSAEFVDFMVQHLAYYIVYVTSGGLGHASSVPACDVFKNWLPSGMLAAIRAGNYFFALGGDTEVFGNMTQRFMSRPKPSLFVNATVTRVKRPGAGDSNGPVKVWFTQTHANGTVSEQLIFARYLVLGLPQYPGNLDFMDLRPAEVAAYANLSYTVYYQLQMSSNTTQDPLYFMNFLNNENYYMPSLPSVTAVFNYQAGPTINTRSGFGFKLGRTSMSLDEVRSEFEGQLAQLANYGIYITLDEITPHDFYTHFNATCLTHCSHTGSGCWQGIYDLQGQWRTFRVGKSIGFEDHMPLVYTALAVSEQIIAQLN
jgi:hypothetical protein